MTRSVPNLLLALLLILAVGGRCVLACVDLTSSPKSEAHKCCKKDKAPKTNCQAQASEAAKAGAVLTPPAGDVYTVSTVLMVVSADHQSSCLHPDYSPPDLSILHQTFLI